ncbi:sulfite exporter TauE/SafE family protein [Neisseriaceae bacterium TC5R-5]|nr:sulfite exporter TauE/SafE family protein [Neisseriaceae bacterium TC5R-5]
MLDTNLWALFLAGLLGGGHCIGMCGGIVTALTLHLPANQSRWLTLLAYNLGRITSYTLVGMLLGGLASSLILLQIRGFQLGLQILANGMLIAMGLYLAGLAGIISRLEKLGAPVWRYLQPLVRRLLPIRSLPGAVLAGLVWGWLPCGLVYSASLSALASASVGQGALTMLVFGLGTLPNLLLMGVFADSLRRWLHKRPVRLLAGLLVVLIGALGLFAVFNEMT